jgi:hypothetical protein
MRFIYYTVTFLAALVILAYAGWQTYLHRNVILNAVPNVNFGKPDAPKPKPHNPIKCKDCTCTDCKCTEGKCCCAKCECPGACCNEKKAGCGPKGCCPPPMPKADE